MTTETDREADGLAAQTGNRAAGRRLFAAYQPFAATVARNCGATDLEESIADGMLGLALAIRTYDPARDRPFDEHAWACIRRAVVDGLRGAGSECTRDARRDGTARTDSLDEIVPSSNGTPEPRSETVADPDAVDPEQSASNRETWRRIFALPAAQRQVLVSRLGGVPAHEVARSRCVSEGRITQITSAAVRALSS